MSATHAIPGLIHMAASEPPKIAACFVPSAEMPTARQLVLSEWLYSSVQVAPLSLELNNSLPEIDNTFVPSAEDIISFDNPLELTPVKVLSVQLEPLLLEVHNLE